MNGSKIHFMLKGEDFKGTDFYILFNIVIITYV